MIVRWNGLAERVKELQDGTVDGIDEVAPDGIETLDADVSTISAARDGIDIVYLGISTTVTPFGNEGVRRALAIGIDRQALIARYLPPGAALSTHALRARSPMPAAGAASYDYDPTLAKETWPRRAIRRAS